MTTCSIFSPIFVRQLLVLFVLLVLVLVQLRDFRAAAAMRDFVHFGGY